MIPYGRQDISEADIEAVARVLRSDWLTQGPTVPAFEAALAQKVGAAHAVAVNSATSALHIACLALELGPGDVLWTVPNTFVASANCGIYCGATVDFVDIDPASYNICVEHLAEKLKQADRLGTLPKVLVAVHHSGQSCQMEQIARLAKAYGVRVIEDASHAIGGSYQNGSIGGCQYSDITVFSLHPVKIITSGEGGLALTDDAALADRMGLLRSHGVTRDQRLVEANDPEPWYYEQIDLGFNYRMTDIQAALGLSQLERLGAYVDQRNRLANRYDALLAGLPLTTPKQDPNTLSARHLYCIRLDLASIGRSRLDVFNELRAKGVGVNVHYIPVHTQPYYRERGFKIGDYPASESYYREALSVPLFPTLGESDQDIVVGALRAAVGAD